MRVIATGIAVVASALLAATTPASAALVDFDFTISYSGSTIKGRLVGLALDSDGNGTEVDPSCVLLYSVPAVVGLPASPSNPYVFVPYTFERSTLFSGIFISTVPGTYGFHVTGFSMTPSAQNLMMVDAGNDVSILFNFGGGLCGECGVPTYGIQGEEDALWPAVNTFVSYTLMPHGDLDNNGSVNGADLAILLAAWGTSNTIADLNNDGTVNGADLALLLAAWTG